MAHISIPHLPVRRWLRSLQAQVNARAAMHHLAAASGRWIPGPPTSPAPKVTALRSIWDINRDGASAVCSKWHYRLYNTPFIVVTIY